MKSEWRDVLVNFIEGSMQFSVYLLHIAEWRDARIRSIHQGEVKALMVAVSRNEKEKVRGGNQDDNNFIIMRVTS